MKLLLDIRLPLLLLGVALGTLLLQSRRRHCIKKTRWWNSWTLFIITVLVLVSAAGTTFASFTDFQTSTGNTVQFMNSWYSLAWGYRKPITINHTKVSNTSQSNFTVLINLTDPTLEYTANGGHVGQSDGGDILFTSSDGKTKLAHEIENYTPSTGRLVAWVIVPTLSASSDTVIYLYYGNANCTDQWNINGTWNSSYNAVWHMEQNPSGTPPQIVDSTTNGNNGTCYGSMTSNDQVAGEIGGSLHFDGSTDYVQVNNSTTLNVSSAITVSAWIYPYSVASGSHRIISKWTSSNQEYIFYLSGTEVGVGAKTGYGVTSGANLSINTWYYLTMVWSGSNTIAVYKNGNLFQNITITTGTTGTSAPLVFAKHGSSSSEYFNGIIDESRVGMTTRSADWIQTEYNNQNSPSTFYTVGIEQ